MTKMTTVFFSSVLAFGGTTASAQELEAVIDWSRWDAILHTNVIDGRVDYGAIAADPGFTATVADIANADLAGCDREALLAFSINAYNVLAVKGILDGHSPASSVHHRRRVPEPPRLREGAHPHPRRAANPLRHRLRVGLVPSPPQRGLPPAKAR